MGKRLVIQERRAMHNHVLLQMNMLNSSSRVKMTHRPSALCWWKNIECSFASRTSYYFFWFVCFVSWTSSSLLTLLILWPSSPLPLCSPLVTVTVTVCLLPTFRVSPLMCCCSLALLNWHVRTFARVKSQLKWTAAENAVCYLFYFFFSTPHPPLCRPCCLWFPSRCTCDPFSFKKKNNNNSNLRPSLCYDTFLHQFFFPYKPSKDVGSFGLFDVAIWILPKIRLKPWGQALIIDTN